jgi:hypothetical protein
VDHLIKPASVTLSHRQRHHDKARVGIDIGPPQFSRQQLPPAEDIPRLIAVANIVAVEEPAFLIAVQRVVGGIEV